MPNWRWEERSRVTLSSSNTVLKFYENYWNNYRQPWNRLDVASRFSDQDGWNDRLAASNTNKTTIECHGREDHIFLVYFHFEVRWPAERSKVEKVALSREDARSSWSFQLTASTLPVARSSRFLGRHFIIPDEFACKLKGQRAGLPLYSWFFHDFSFPRILHCTVVLQMGSRFSQILENFLYFGVLPREKELYFSFEFRLWRKIKKCEAIFSSIDRVVRGILNWITIFWNVSRCNFFVLLALLRRKIEDDLLSPKLNLMWKSRKKILIRNIKEP